MGHPGAADIAGNNNEDEGGIRQEIVPGFFMRA
jgi:hypothetical protein